MLNKKLSKAKKIALGIFLGLLVFSMSSQSVIASPIHCYFKHWISFHGGFTSTTEDWLVRRLNWNIIIDFKIYCWYHWAFILEAGYNRFKWDIDEVVPDVDLDFYWWNFNPTLRYYLGGEKITPFISFGPGWYEPKDGDGRFGAKLGLGLDFNVSDRIMLEVGSDFHHIFLKEADSIIWGDNYQFFHFHGGIIINLGSQKD